VAACQEVGLKVVDANMNLSHEAGTRVNHVSASKDEVPADEPMLSMLAMVSVTGDWPEFVDVRCSACFDGRSAMQCPWMKGRDQVPLDALIDELRATLEEREQVIAAMQAGVTGPYRFGLTTHLPARTDPPPSTWSVRRSKVRAVATSKLDEDTTKEEN
jgi:hypothetical protein